MSAMANLFPARCQDLGKLGLRKRSEKRVQVQDHPQVLDHLRGGEVGLGKVNSGIKLLKKRGYTKFEPP